MRNVLDVTRKEHRFAEYLADLIDPTPHCAFNEFQWYRMQFSADLHSQIVFVDKEHEAKALHCEPLNGFRRIFNIRRSDRWFAHVSPNNRSTIYGWNVDAEDAGSISIRMCTLLNEVICRYLKGMYPDTKIKIVCSDKRVCVEALEAVMKKRDACLEEVCTPATADEGGRATPRADTPEDSAVEDGRAAPRADTLEDESAA